MQCSALTRDGKPCGQVANVSPETGLCFWHDPARKAEAAAARAAGNSSRSAPPSDNLEPPGDIVTLEDVHRHAQWVYRLTATGAFGEKRAHELNGLLNTLVRALKETKLEARMKALESQLKELRKAAA